jgi:hypothetical protein
MGTGTLARLKVCMGACRYAQVGTNKGATLNDTASNAARGRNGAVGISTLGRARSVVDYPGSDSSDDSGDSDSSNSSDVE